MNYGENPFQLHSSFHSLIEDLSQDLDIEDLIDEILDGNEIDISKVNEYFKISLNLQQNSNIIHELFNDAINNIDNSSKEIQLKSLDFIYVILSKKGHKFLDFSSLNYANKLLYITNFQDIRVYLFIFGILYNNFIVERDNLYSIDINTLISLIHDLISSLDPQNLIISDDKSYFFVLFTNFMKNLFKLLIYELQDEEFYHRIWVLSFEMINHKSGESMLASCGFSVLCQLLDHNFKQNLSDDDLNSILIFSNENAKIIEPIYKFISNFHDTTVINALFKKGLMSNIISILQQKKIESSIVLRFLKTIEYIPTPNDIIFLATIELFNSQLNPVKIAAVNYASVFIQQTPSSEIMSAIPKPPFLLLSSLIDESDLEISLSSIKIIEKLLNIMIIEGIKLPSNLVASKIVSALDEIYGLNQEIDERADLIIQILHPED